MEKWIGVPPTERKSKNREIILRLIGEDWISWSELYEKVRKERIGKATLSRHLKKLMELNLVERRIDTSEYPPKVYYKRRGDPLKQLEEFSSRISKVIERVLNKDTVREEECILISEALNNLSLLFHYYTLRLHSLLNQVKTEVIKKEFEIDKNILELLETLPEDVKLKIRELMVNKYGLKEVKEFSSLFLFDKDTFNMLKEIVETLNLENILNIIKRYEEAIKIAWKHIEEMEERAKEIDDLSRKLKNIVSSFEEKIYSSKAVLLLEGDEQFISEKINSLIESIEKVLRILEKM